MRACWSTTRIRSGAKSLQRNSELFNEPTFAAVGGAPRGYDAADYARDSEAFRRFARTAVPHMLNVGPGSVGEGIKLMPGPLLATADLLSGYPRPTFDVFSYHSYADAGNRSCR